MGRKNQQHDYRLGNYNLKKASEERDQWMESTYRGYCRLYHSEKRLKTN